jgi:nitrate/TMAO reductase-like tetraheme cytochrome c subunit
VNRPALLLHSPIVVALGIAMSMVGGKLILAQLPGVCTLPDGSSWSGPAEFERAAIRPSEIAARLSSTDGRNSQFSEIATDPQLVRRWLRGEVVSNSLPSQNVASNPQASVINRYAPHSIPMTKDGSKSAIPIHNLSLRSLPQDDLLAPTGNNDATNLLEASPPSFAEGDVLSQMGPDAQREKERAATKTGDAGKQAAVDPHWEVFANDKYPSAIKCSKCHQKIYDEWRVSSHAYAAVSPMFHRFEQKVAELTRGTSGTFCLRCHAPVATQADFPRNASIFNGPIVFREGITCIACHRVIERYGRVNGERRIELGSEYDPVVGNIGGEGVRAVIADRDNFKVKIDPNDTRPLQPIHQGAIQFEQLSDSSFCAGCHQVVVQPGIALEIVYQQYRQGPACKKGVSCQDCHMGAVPGKPLGYTFGAAAEVSGKTINTQRKHSNHVFYGPAYPIAHPGIFPHNEKSLRWTADQWLQFDHRQGWGTERFEALLARGQITANFPPGWHNIPLPNGIASSHCFASVVNCKLCALF